LIEAENSKKIAELNKVVTGINAKAQAEALHCLEINYLLIPTC